MKKDLSDYGIGTSKQFDFCEFRERDWSNVLTCNEKSNLPYLWSSTNHSIAKVPVESLYP